MDIHVIDNFNSLSRKLESEFFRERILFLSVLTITSDSDESAPINLYDSIRRRFKKFSFRLTTFCFYYISLRFITPDLFLYIMIIMFK